MKRSFLGQQMQNATWFAVAGLVLLVPPLVKAAAPSPVRLLLDSAVARPGQTVIAAVQIQLQPGWHTYWRNGGESGQAPSIKWTLPTGVSAGTILWPVPKKAAEEGLTTYVLNREAVLLVPLTVAADVASAALELKAAVSWLECEKQCVPKSASVAAELTVGSEGRRSADADRIATWQRLLPVAAEPGAVRASWAGAAGKEGARTLQFELAAPPGAQRAEFFPDAADDFEVKAATESLLADGKLRIRKPVEKSKDAAWPTEVSGLTVCYDTSGEVTKALETKVGISSGTAQTPAVGPKKSTGAMLLSAFIGGLILNVMPCVLPVIALKIYGFIRQSGESSARVRRLGLVYAAGVVCSFVVLAGIAIGLQSLGKQTSWGMQFGSPVFLVIVTTLMTVIALNLFGVFEVTLNGGALSAATSMASREGFTGAFFNGVFATALATSCTAPFLGAAMGWALAPEQSPALIFAAFVTVGIGLAFPYVVLTSFPVLMKFVPKPGAWMEHFKVAIGFAAMGAAVWLFTLMFDHFGDRIVWLGVFLVVVSFAAWVFGVFYQRATGGRAAVLIVVLLLLVGGYVLVLEGQLHWRGNVVAGIAWKPWSHESVEAARRQGKVVFVDFTAKWCTTCQANKRSSIEIASVQDKLKSLDAVTLLGDYTLVPDEMTTELKKFDRAGVPLVLVYPKDASKPPKVLPELLTPSIVLNALDEAAN